MAAILRFVLKSRVAQVCVTLVLYAIYACIIGASIFPAGFIVQRAFGRLLSGRASPGAASLLLFCIILAGAAFVALFCCLLLCGVVVRLFSLGVRPGRHPLASRTTLLWMALNGLHTICFRALLPLVPSSFFTTMYFRLAGCRIGRDAWLTTTFLFDPYLITIGKGTVIGGDAVITAHLFESGMLTLAPIRIGENCMIGAHALISPGVTIEDGVVVGVRTYIREGRRIARGSRIASMGGLPAGRLLELEGRPGRRDSGRRDSGRHGPGLPSRDAREPRGKQPGGSRRP